MCRKLTYLVCVVLVLGIASGPAVAGVSYQNPPGGWLYIFNGDAAAPAVTAALDGKWDHYDDSSGGSDAWDGSGIGAGLPGGVSALVEGVSFLRIQDVFPRDPGAEPSNRKIYFGHNITAAPEGAPADLLDSGVTVSFRVRLSTTPPVDNFDGGATPWPAGGDGYVGHDGGKGNFGIRAANDKLISFCLSLASDQTAFLGGKQGLTMNSRNGTAPNDAVDVLDGEGTLNILEIADLKAWHEFFINIKADTSGSGTHLVKIWMDGSLTPTEFHVTASTANETNYAAFGYLALGCGNTGQAGAFDTDFFAYKPGLYAPGGENKAWNPAPHNTTINADFVTLTWDAGGSAALHDVYFSDNFNDVNTASNSDPMGADKVYKARQSATKYPPGDWDTIPVTWGKTYYWRIDEVNDLHADKLWRGDVWSFEVVSSLNWNPSPPHQDTYVPVTTDLSWSKGALAKLGHIIYLSTDFSAVDSVAPGTTSGPAYLGSTSLPTTTTIVIPGDLLYGTTYYWRADPVESNPPLTAHKGAVWSFTTVPPGVGSILRQIWQGITPQTTAISSLYDWPDFPYNPTITDTLTSFVSDPDWDDYGGRIHGWVYAPVSGDYRFYLTSDDNGQLWLSTDEDPANAQLIAWESGSRTLYNWASGEEDSDLIPLVGGMKYYISALWKERGGGDHCAVGWTGPGITSITVIPGRYLMPYVQYWAWDPLPADEAVGVATTPTLDWLPGARAASHNVYFGTVYADVKAGTGGTFKGNQPLGDTDYVPPAALTAGKLYYWKITEVNDLHADKKWEGPVWVFRVAGGAGGLLGAYYQHTGGAAPAGFETFKLSRIDPEVNFGWGTGSPDPLVDINDFSCRWSGQVEVPLSEDYTFYTASDDGARLWVDGQLVIDRWVDQGGTEWPSSPIALVAGQKYDIKMEQYENEGGATAYLRWSSPSISKRIIPSIWLWPPTKATNPTPADGSTTAPLQPTLSWTAGVYAAAVNGHRVYFDPDEAKVIARAGCQVNGTPTTNPTYLLPWTFGLEETFYWAVDEVNGVNSWRGDTWSFTTANNKLVDDMETYTPWDVPDNNIFEVWVDGPGDCHATSNNTGALVDIDTATAVHGGLQSMKYLYDNDGTVDNPCEPGVPAARLTYSKAEAQVAKLPSGSDWTVGGVAKSLSLWFYGDTFNSIEPMWVQLTDASNNKDKVFYGDYADEDTSDMNEASWHEWLIDLADFTGVSASNVKSIAIGIGNEPTGPAGSSGTLYFDDIRLYTPRCVLTRRPADFALVDYAPAGTPPGDCRVDYREIERMADQWLLGKEAEVAWAPALTWVANDIGSTATPGSFTANGDGSYSVTGSGADIWGTADAFHYVFKPLVGDGQMTVNVVSIAGTSTNEWQKAGVMIRETLAAGSRNVMMLMSAGGASANFGGGDAFQWRPVADAASSSSHVVCDNVEVLPPNCVRLVRTGNMFSGFVYVNGQWVQEGQTVTIAMPETVYIGLAVTSHDNAAGIYTTATFNNVCDSSFGGLLSELTGDGLIDFADYAVIGSRWLDEDVYP